MSHKLVQGILWFPLGFCQLFVGSGNCLNLFLSIKCPNYSGDADVAVLSACHEISEVFQIPIRTSVATELMQNLFGFKG